ncbi:hypothetical protein PVAP13_4NG071888, partial [Panicum virgatum]
PNGGGTLAAKLEQIHAQEVQIHQWKLRPGAQAGGRMSMEEGKSMGGSGEGGGNCGGRGLGSPPAATAAAVAGQGGGSGRPGDAEGGGGPAARLGSLASPRGGDDR